MMQRRWKLSSAQPDLSSAKMSCDLRTPSSLIPLQPVFVCLGSTSPLIAKG
jgi:hypothetical protein